MSGSVDLINQLSQTLGGASQKATDDVMQFSAEMDPTQPQDLFKMQMRMTKMSITNQLEMQILSSVQETLKSMVQRIS